MKRKFNEWLSTQVIRNPGGMVLFAILMFNILFLIVSSFVISRLCAQGGESMGFFEAIYYTITMILDAGCISSVITNLSTSSIVLVISCIIIIIIGMISFTGAMIGYVTNTISGFIENTNAGSRKLVAYDHIVILNWNTRASEIVNDLLYTGKKEKIAILVSGRKEEIEKEIDERLSDTIARENAELIKKCKEKNMSFARKMLFMHKNKFRQNLTVIVREGDVFSSKQLRDISLEHAKMIVILSNDINSTLCKFEYQEKYDTVSRGNSQTIKTLMQVADITASADSDDDQKIIVEINDDWTAELVDKIIRSKQVEEKCNIVPIHVNKVLGQILSQFSLMPELNYAYNELFSNRGATFFAKEQPPEDDEEFIRRYLLENNRALPLTFMKAEKRKGSREKDKYYCYYAANDMNDINSGTTVTDPGYRVEYNYDYWIEQKNVIILGHNSKSRDIMRGFESFRNEWGVGDRGEIVRIVVIDDERFLKRMDFYKDYPFVVETVAADIYDKELICETIERLVDKNTTDTSVLILSDDSAVSENIDANALANLIYVQDIVRKKKEENPDFDEESIDIIVEIIDPKHHDVVNSYCVNNVVISNRYVSKMLTQIGEKKELYDFYTDILSYDDAADSGKFESKEIYCKKLTRMLRSVPQPCTAQDFVRSIYYASVDTEKCGDNINPSIVLGYVKPGGKVTLFNGDQSKIWVELSEKDKLIVFSNH